MYGCHGNCVFCCHVLRKKRKPLFLDWWNLISYQKYRENRLHYMCWRTRMVRKLCDQTGAGAWCRLWFLTRMANDGRCPGYDNIQQYVDNPNNNYGGLIGRYGNRIANGKFSLNGVEYQLPLNNNGHCCMVVRKVTIRLFGMPNR